MGIPNLDRIAETVHTRPQDFEKHLDSFRELLRGLGENLVCVLGNCNRQYSGREVSLACEVLGD